MTRTAASDSNRMACEVLATPGKPLHIGDVCRRYASPLVYRWLGKRSPLTLVRKAKLGWIVRVGPNGAMCGLPPVF